MSHPLSSATSQPSKVQRLVRALREKAGALPDEFFQQRGLMHMAADVLTNFQAEQRRQSATPSPYDCGGNPTKDFPGE